MKDSGAELAASPVASSHIPANRWAVLALLGVAQLMVGLHVTIVKIAAISGSGNGAGCRLRARRMPGRPRVALRPEEPLRANANRPRD
jgi:hypothetical protein